MNRRSAVSIGPGAASLILIFVVLALSILGMLSLLTARNDVKFADRSAEVIQTVYQLNEMAEEHRAQVERILAADPESLEENLPEEMELFDDEISWTEEIQISLDTDSEVFVGSDGRTMMLDCALRVLPDAAGDHTEWIRHDLTVYTEDDEWNW